MHMRTHRTHHIVTIHTKHAHTYMGNALDHGPAQVKTAGEMWKFSASELKERMAEVPEAREIDAEWVFNICRGVRAVMGVCFDWSTQHVGSQR